jgi:putative tricarboxylic transport membrane protein
MILRLTSIIPPTAYGLTEVNLRRALILSEGSYNIFITRPISLIFVLLTIFTLVMFFRINMKKESVA